MQSPFDEQARRAFEAQQRAQANSRFWNRQLFKLVYILCVIFVLPVALCGFAALYLAIYEPETLQRAIKARPQGPKVDDLESPSFFVREAALKKLVKGPADRTQRDVAEKIKKLLSDQMPAIQELAIDSLGDWGQPEDAAALATLSRERMSVFVRPKICVALGKLQGEQALDALIDISGMGWTEQEHALRAIATFGPAAEPALLKRGETADVSLKPSICLALQSLGTAASLPFLETAAKDENPQVADAARKAIAAIGKRAK